MAKSIFITGAAAGIGRAVAERFSSEGWFVGLLDINVAEALELQRQLGHEKTFVGHLDVSDPEDWATQLARFYEVAGGRLDVLVNNAGISLTSLFEEVPLASHHRLIDINIKGLINGCHQALPYLKRNPGSRVINLCSASALYGQPMLSSYSAAKAAVRSLTESLDIEWRRHRVRVVDVLPLFVSTAMVANDVQKMKTVQLLGVRLSADDVGRCIWKLAQRNSNWLPVHTPVGLQTRAFYSLSKWSPEWITRLVTARMAGF